MFTPHKSSYISSANYIRAFASISVTLFHLGGKSLPVLKYGWLGVELFFVLSGFIICWSIPMLYSLSNFKTFLKKRLIRIEPPYIISIVLAIASFYLLNETDKISWRSIIYHLGYLPNIIDIPYYNVVYWTLGIEFQFYILIGLFFQFFNKQYSKYILIVICIILSFLNIKSTTLLTHFPLFAMGMYSFLYKRDLITMKELIFYILLISILISIFSSPIQSLAGAFTSFFLLLDLPFNKLINFFAKISFSLYLTHDLIGSKLVVYLGTMFSKNLEIKALIFLFGFFISVLFAYIFFILIEKPFLKKSKNLNY